MAHKDWKSVSDESLIAHYTHLMKRMQVTRPEPEPPISLSRPDVLLKLKELKESVAQCKAERVESFLASKDLRLLMEDQLVDALLRVVRSAKTSERPSLGIALKDSATKDEGLSSKLSSQISSEVPVFTAQERERTAISPLKEVLAEVEQTEFEAALLGKQKLRVELRRRSATLIPPDSFSAYVKVAEPSESGELALQKRWLVIDPAAVCLYSSSAVQECLLRVETARVVAVSEEEEDCLKVAFKEADEESALLMYFYTDSMQIRCGEVFKTLSKVKSFPYISAGEQANPLLSAPTERRRSKRLSEFHKFVPIPDPPKASSPSCLSQEASDHSSPSQDDIYLSDEGEEPAHSSAAGMTPQATLTTRPEERGRALTDLAEELDEKGLTNLLTKGGVFLKYGRYGGPKLRHVMVTGDLKFIEWRPLNKPHYKRRSGVAVHSIKKVVIGRSTKRFKKFPNPARDEDSFSLICTERDLDLEVHKPGTGHNQRVWAAAFERLAQGLLTREMVERFVAKQHRPE